MSGGLDPERRAGDGASKRLVVGLTGSSAPQLGLALLRALRELPAIETHLVVSAGARLSLRLEAGVEVDEVEALADVSYPSDDLGASISSGSFQTIGMVVMPCSMRSLAAIATGLTSDLVGRAADVTLKERRTLVLVPRETPLNLVHIRNMETVTLAGGVVLPPMPAFYHRPTSIDDLLDHIVGKVLDQFAVRHELYRRWTGHGDREPGA
jgi:polyprenyl P-hydroxybenzoate/phenylacrylic acid decarboxylase-like protein